MKPLRSKAELLQVPMLLVRVFKQGNVNLQTNGVENIQLRIQNKKIDLNFLQKEQLKTLLELEAEMKEESILRKLKTLKSLAEKLKQDGFTIIISYKDKTILTLGSEAKPSISQMATGTATIEINNLLELIKLAK